ncbi:biosynthetic peptidoglycan transglycosylase [Vitiosangium sp. GDMCC 1.1324]|uniref:biosynthetic peptidoglycan transglycosylase n=1 Tax=Vitiosangium sp. (strain GDMCC 1.1324) TaxID=2138576 RepID=UPI000D36427F|nr:biosynthetic peptidoglycan transglycosylase [Vitiosangium sp. GDMCC 1.1324]PTL80640.1 glycosyl transferase [Vitiosangium sp. GDMCC 1.1324]
MSPLPRRPSKRGLLVLLLLALLIAVSGLAGHTWLQGEAVRARVLARVKPALESRLGPVHIGEDFHIGWTGTVMLGPVELPGTRPEGPPVVRISRVTVHLRRMALLSGHVEASRVVLSGVAVEAGPRGQEVRALVARVRDAREKRHPVPASSSDGDSSRELPELVLKDVRLAFERHGRVEWGPLSARVRLEGSAEAPRLEATAELPGGGSAALSVQRGESGFSGTLRGQDVQAGPLLSLAEPPVRLEGGTLEGEVRVDASGGTFSLVMTGLSVSSPQLAPEPMGPFAFSAEGRAHWDMKGRHAELESLRLTVGEHREAHVEVHGEAAWSREPHFSLQAELQPLSFEQAMAALPAALVPGSELARLEGHFQAFLTLSGPMLHRRDWEVKAKLDLSELKHSARAGPLAWLREPFDYRPLTNEGRGRELNIGPENPSYVPLAELPRPLVRAVLRSEDAAFWIHRGFDFDSLRTILLAPEDNKVRGGSTLTQQLAKNLFLSREKTYARKVKEAFLTLGLEASVPKERLLEVYFNIIEWGPNLYGIGEAARHYFGNDARELSIRESAFLATIIPNPVRYHVYCSRGALSDIWKKNVDDLLTELYAGGDITQAEYQEALTAPLVFAGHHGSQPLSDEETPIRAIP